ncbi:uncharacterized protein ARMOST_07965 [Armillaria ostoyae]|uniref:Uncharacterized protein n=1 Tax=Armillaria ostoyae TaxID=47428 RepID=A0A284R7A0_ARMOS|nr:uncharacterized protein ARMOST_07965 [Armillaria ostoyae]
MSQDTEMSNRFFNLMKLALDAGPLTPEQKSMVQSLIVPVPKAPMHIETATIPTGFTTVTTSVSYAFIHLVEGDVYFRCSNVSAPNFWVVAQVVGVSKFHQQGGFATMADAEAYMLSYVKKSEAWGIMFNQPSSAGLE